MPPTNPYVDKLADIQAHLMSGGMVQTAYAAIGRGTVTYDRSDVLRFCADSTGLYVTTDSGLLCLNTATVSLR